MITHLFEAAIPNPSGHRDVRPEQVFADEKATRLVDVREPHEFTGELGHIQGAELVPLATVASAAGRWPRAEPLVLICRSGQRSERAAIVLTAAGFRYVMNMVGGMLAWKEARLPVEGAISSAI
jgi:rhodanese-related sulfurtransferase